MIQSIPMQLNSDSVISNNLYWLLPKALDLPCMRINGNHMKVSKFLIVHDILCSLMLDFSKHSEVLSSIIEGDGLQKCECFSLASDKNPNLTRFHKSLEWKSVRKELKSPTFSLWYSVFLNYIICCMFQRACSLEVFTICQTDPILLK